MTDIYQYKAFISYSHTDKVAGDMLLKELESYRVPKRLVGKDATNGTSIPSRVGHIFRDRDELPAAEDLTAEVKKALTQSEFMIVLCSPAAAASRWVNREIIEFKKLTGERRILSVILSGEPFASNGTVPEQECFPPALRFKLGKNGALTTKPAEPLAADFRVAGDGPRRGKLKLVAGLLGIGLDALIERDLQRKMRRVMAVTAASVLAMIGMATLTYEAVTARQDAERHRGEAEGLIEFMLTDLRQELIGVGRLNVMTGVNKRTMEFYQELGDVNDLPDESLGRWSRIMHAWGIDDELRGDWQGAKEKYKEFHRTARILWTRNPDNFTHILAYAESVNRLAITKHSLNDGENVLEQFFYSMEILETSPSTSRNSVGFLKLSALINGNLCAANLGVNKQPEGTLHHCEDAVAQSERATALDPANSQIRYEYIFHIAWLAESAVATNDLESAEKALRQAINLSEDLSSKEPDNTRWQEQLMELYTRFFRFAKTREQNEKPLAYLIKAQAINRKLIKTEPSNSHWSGYNKQLQKLIEKEADHGGKR